MARKVRGLSHTLKKVAVAMELQKTKHELKLAQWRKLMPECSANGMRIKDWCEEWEICTQPIPAGSDRYGM